MRVCFAINLCLMPVVSTICLAQVADLRADFVPGVAAGDQASYASAGSSGVWSHYTCTSMDPYAGSLELLQWDTTGLYEAATDNHFDGFRSIGLSAPYASELLLHPGVPGIDAQPIVVSRFVFTDAIDGGVISGTIRKTDTRGGDGVYAALYVDGDLIWSQNVAYNDASGPSFAFLIPSLTLGSEVSWVLGPRGSNDFDSTAVALTISCKADLNQDGLLEFSDIQLFLHAFANEGSLADMNADGLFDIFDVNQFLAAFFRGCP